MDESMIELVKERDEAQREAEALRVELDALSERLGAVTLRPTYDARPMAPTPAERLAHRGARWLIVRHHGRGELPHVSTWIHYGGAGELMPEDVPPPTGGKVDMWVPLGPDGLPCAWPEVAQ